MAEVLWRDVAPAYDRSFATLCAGTAPAVLAELGAPARVLDVGCGSGHLTAALVAAGHRVTALDPDPEMVALAADRAAVPVRRGGLPDLPAVGAHDAVVANFVLNHVDDPRRAAAGLPAALRPGGRVVATIWPASPPPQAQLWGAVLEAAGGERPSMPRLDPTLDFERSPDGLADVLGSAGLEVEQAGLLAWEWRVAPEDFWAGATSVGNFGVTWRAQSDEVRRAMATAFGEAVAHWRQGDHLVFPVQAVRVWARG